MGRNPLLFTLTIAVLIIPSLLSAGWLRTYGGEGDDWGSCVQQTSDGGCIVVGYTESFVDPSGDIWLLKFNQAGDTLWTKVYGDTSADYGYCVKQTSEGGYVIASSVGLIKTDADGEMQWIKPYPARYVDLTDDAGYILASERNNNACLIRLDSKGDTLWTREYLGDFPSEANFVQTVSDGGYLVTGQQTEIGLTDAYLLDYAWFLKTDSMGEKLWEISYQGDATTCGYSACQITDGGYVFAGDHVGWAASVHYLLLIKTDAQGDWEWFYDRDSDNRKENHTAYGVAPSSDGGCVVTGEYWYTLMKVNNEGTIDWKHTYPFKGMSIQQTEDGGYILTGIGSGDLHLLKTDWNGDLYLLKTNASGDTLGIAEQPGVFEPSNWELVSPVGNRVILQYHDIPQGFHASVFDAAGRKVDEIYAAGSSGTISWGDGYGSGVYFIRIGGIADKGAARIVLIR